MAKLPAIIDLIAKHDTRSVATITNYARVLRDAGILPKGKRGRGAPDLDPIEVADLVLALSGASDAVDAPHAVAVLRNAKVQPNLHMDGGDLVPWEQELPHWSFHEEGTTFGTFLASLLVELPRRDDCPDDSFGVTNMSITINEVSRNEASGSAEAYVDDGNLGFSISYFFELSPDDAARFEKTRGREVMDKTWSRSTTIDYAFFFDANMCLAGEIEPVRGK